MIKGFKHKGLQQFFESGSTKGINPQHAAKLRIRLSVLHSASTLEGLSIPSYRLHPLTGCRKGQWSIWVTGNWRITFNYIDGDAYVVNYEDYH